MAKLNEKIEWEDKVFDIYNPEFSSDEEKALVSTCSLSGENGSRVTVTTSINRSNHMMSSASSASVHQPKKFKSSSARHTKNEFL